MHAKTPLLLYLGTGTVVSAQDGRGVVKRYIAPYAKAVLQ